MKFKALALVAALAAAGAAHADIGSSASAGTVEAFVTVFNSKATITIDLGLDHDTFASPLASALTYNLAANSQWSAFMTAANGGGNLLWSVQSLDTDINNGWTTVRTTQEALWASTTGAYRGNGTLDSGYADLNMFQQAVNTSGDVTTNDTKVGLAGTAQYWTLDGANLAFGVNNTSNFVGATSKLFQAQDNVADPYNAGAKWDTTVSKNTVTLDGNYTLTFQAAPVPEPESYGLALAALATIGFVARRRSV